jgi:hypothetical protein
LINLGKIADTLLEFNRFHVQNLLPVHQMIFFFFPLHLTGTHFFSEFKELVLEKENFFCTILGSSTKVRFGSVVDLEL